MPSILKITLTTILLIPLLSYGGSWQSLWQTPDQQAMALLQHNNADAAAKTFINPDWQSVANYRAKHYAAALKQFSAKQSSDGQYNAGNAAAFAGEYERAIKAYDKAIILNNHNVDAKFNRDIIQKILDKKQQENKNDKEKQNEQKKNKDTNKEKNQDQDKSKNKGNNPEKNQSANKPDQNSSADNTNTQAQSSSKESPQNASKPEPRKTDNEKKSSETSPDKTQHDESQKQSDEAAAQQAAAKTPPATPNSEDQKDSGPESEKPSENASDKIDRENQDQLLRRLDDNPSGLLKNKFQRDYLRRHSENNDLDSGETR
jgi:Ca-activated chloride channel family protein